MAVSLFFGLPGCGKTTIMASIAYKAVKSKKYENVYCNVKLSIPGVIYIDNSCIGKYVLEHGLILIDEASLYADSRDYKNFSIDKLTYFLEHRHFNVDIYMFTQQWDGVDRKIRVITDRVYYVYKGIFLGKWFSRYYRIPYGIIIPDPKDGSQKLGEIIQGYCKPNFLIRLLSPWIYRPKYYKYFDSWERPDGFHPLPSRYHPYIDLSYGDPCYDIKSQEAAERKQRRHKAVILLRSIPAQFTGAIKRSCATLSVFFDKVFRPTAK